ncbi:MAG TPA: alpha-amylase family glycosyl hydrolase, partial [Pyrinomonadaceae bacterium]|nr:alpha-amylase family glycosyl hydrolase [Pyrinomonadaceae bacterium]
MKRSHRFYWLSLLTVLGLLAIVLPLHMQTALASHTPPPSSVTIAGSFQSELGCPGDWQPECGNTHLTYDANDEVWQATFNVPAGNWFYKAPVNDNWGENYGRFAQQNGPDIPLNLGSPANVKFYYDHETHWVTSNKNAVIAVAPGSFQSELGCSGDWDPSCLRSWLQDPDEDGIYRFETTALPAGDYFTKVAINESWDENYGQGGVQNGADIQFNVPTNNALVKFSYNASTHILTIEVGGGPPPGGDIQWDGLRHDTFNSYYRSPFGAVPAGTNVTLRFRTAHFDVDGVSVRVYTYNPATDATTGPVDHPMSFLENITENSTTYDVWSLTLATPASPSILYYKFRVTDASDTDFYSDSYTDDHDNLNQGGEGAAFDNEPFPAFQITAYDPAFQTPAWLQNANVYHIFPDRFRNGDTTNDYCRPGSTAGCPLFYGNQQPLLREPWNIAIGDPRQPGPYQNEYGTQFYGGDLKGIENQLDYLQSVGVDTLYLNPIFKARSNHRYDTDNFLEVDPGLGGDAALASLKTEMERRGMRLILDGVFNHSSSDSLYFDRYHRYGPPDSGCENASSPNRSWYNFFGSGPCDGQNYDAWFGFDSLPVFRDDSNGVRDFFYRTPNTNVTEYWYDRGASGWRFDVANEISHNWWNEYRPLAKGYKADGPLIGEIWPDASQWLAGDQLDSVMNYRFRKNVLGFARGQFNWGDNDNSGGNQIIALSPSQFDHALRSVREDYPAEASAAMLNLIDSHDTNRSLYVLTITGDNGLVEAKERLQLSALFQFTYLGAPMIYYGDEAAIDAPSLANGTNGPEDDPYNRAPFPWADEDGDDNVYGPADQNVTAYYTKLAHMRKQHNALRTGSFETLLTGDTTASSTDNSTFAFARQGGTEAAIVALNNGTGSNTASVPVAAYFADGTQLKDALSGTTYTVSSGNVTLTLAARSGAVLFDAANADVDTTAPVGQINVAPAANANGWHNSSPVTVNLSATDGGSGVKELRYWVNGGSVVVTSGSATSIAVSTEGTTTVNLRAVDNAGNVSSLVTRVVKLDVTKPNVSCPVVPDAQANASCQAAIPNVTSGVTASDNLTPVGSLVITQSPTAGTMVGLGTHNITVTVTDLAGNSQSCTTTFKVVDGTAPSVTGVSVSPSVLSPPNHKMVNVTVNYLTADNCGAGVTCTLSVTSNEPVNGAGDGDTAPDWEIVDAHHVRLRAERSGSGTGRVYTIT